jgi:RNA polymerase sigma factor (sigma-70 family)
MLAADLSTTNAPGSADLLRAAWAGDEHAWAQLVSRHTGLLWSITRSYRLGRAAADDVIQTVWLRLLERDHTIRDPGAVTAWLVSTARRECLAATAEGGDATRSVADPGSPAEPNPLPARDRLLWRAFHRLSEPDCLLLVLLAHGIPYEEVAAALDMSRGSVGPAEVRALRTLRAELAGSAGYDPTDALPTAAAVAAAVGETLVDAG